MRTFGAGLALLLVSRGTATAGELDVAYASMERIIVSTFLTEGDEELVRAPGALDAGEVKITFEL